MPVALANPRRTRRRARRTGGGAIVRRAANPAALANPRRRRRRSSVRRYKANPILMPNPRRRRARRYKANPLILPNRGRRRNPSLPSINAALRTLGTGAVGATAGYTVNRYLISKIAEGDASGTAIAKRGAARAAIAVAASHFIGGQMGAGIVGATLYPLVKELHEWWATRQATTTQADLEYGDVLDGVY